MALTELDRLPEQFAVALNTRNLDLVDTFVSRESYRNHNPWVEDGIDSMKRPGARSGR